MDKRFNNRQYTNQILIVLIIFILLFLFFFISENTFVSYRTIINNKILISLALSIIIVFFLLISFYYNNITSTKKQNELALKNQAQERKIRNEILNSLNNHNDYFCLVDSKSNIVWANEACLKVDEYMIGKNINDVFLTINELHGQESIFQNAIEKKQTISKTKYYKQDATHTTEKYIKFNYTPLFNIDDEPIYLFISAIDVTVITQSITSKGRINSVIEASEDAIFVIDKQGIILSWNSSANKIFGYTADEVIGQPLTILDHFIDFEILISIVNNYSTHSIKHIDLIPCKRLDKKMFVSFTVYPYFDETGEILGISIIVKDKTDIVLSQNALIESEKKMRNLALHLDNIRESERKQIAFAIHDELGYALSSIKKDVEWLQNKLNLEDSNIKTRITEMSELIDTSIQEVKDISLNLRPSILDHFGLAAAIEWQAGEFQRRMSIRCKVNIEPPDLNVEENVKVPIFRIFQEALTNITRYAKAFRVDVNLTLKNNILELNVIDNGIGIPENKINDPNSFGLLGIKEKANSIGGIAIIKRNENGPGTTVSLRLELNKSNIIKNEPNRK